MLQEIAKPQRTRVGDHSGWKALRAQQEDVWTGDRGSWLEVQSIWQAQVSRLGIGYSWMYLVCMRMYSGTIFTFGQEAISAYTEHTLISCIFIGFPSYERQKKWQCQCPSIFYWLHLRLKNNGAGDEFTGGSFEAGVVNQSQATSAGRQNPSKLAAAFNFQPWLKCQFTKTEWRPACARPRLRGRSGKTVASHTLTHSSQAGRRENAFRDQTARNPAHWRKSCKGRCVESHAWPLSDL